MWRSSWDGMSLKTSCWPPSRLDPTSPTAYTFLHLPTPSYTFLHLPNDISLTIEQKDLGSNIICFQFHYPQVKHLELKNANLDGRCVFFEWVHAIDSLSYGGLSVEPETQVHQPGTPLAVIYCATLPPMLFKQKATIENHDCKGSTTWIFWSKVGIFTTPCLPNLLNPRKACL